MASLLETHHLDATSTKFFRGSLGYADTEGSYGRQIRIPLTEAEARPGSNLTFYLPPNLGYLTDIRFCYTIHLEFDYYPSVEGLIAMGLSTAMWTNPNALEKRMLPTWKTNNKPEVYEPLFISQKGYALDFPVNLGAFSIVSYASLETTTGNVFTEYNNPIQLEKWNQWNYTTKSDQEMVIFDSETQSGILHPQTIQPSLQPPLGTYGKMRAFTYRFSEDNKKITFSKKVCVPFPFAFPDKWMLYLIGGVYLRINLHENLDRVFGQNIIRTNGYLDLIKDFAFGYVSDLQPNDDNTLADDATNTPYFQNCNKSILSVGVAMVNNDPTKAKYTVGGNVVPIAQLPDNKVTMLKFTFQGLRLSTQDLDFIIGAPTLQRANPSGRIDSSALKQPNSGKLYGNPASTLRQTGGVLHLRLSHMDLPTTKLVNTPQGEYAESIHMQGFAALRDTWARVPIYPSNIAGIYNVGMHEVARITPEASIADESEQATAALGEESCVYIAFCVPVTVLVPAWHVNLNPILSNGGDPPTITRRGGYGVFLDAPQFGSDELPEGVDPVLPLMREQNLGVEFQFNIGEPLDRFATPGDGSYILPDDIPLKYVTQNSQGNMIYNNYNLSDVEHNSYDILQPTKVTYTDIFLQATKKTLSDGVHKYLESLYEAEGIPITAVAWNSISYNLSTTEGVELDFISSKTQTAFFTFELRSPYNNVNRLPLGQPVLTMEYFKLQQGSFIVKNVLAQEQALVIGNKFIQPHLTYVGGTRSTLYQKPTGCGPTQSMWLDWSQAFGNATGESEKEINCGYLHSLQYTHDTIYNCQTRDGMAHFAEQTSWKAYFKVRKWYPGNSLDSRALITDYDTYVTKNVPDKLSFTETDVFLADKATSQIPSMPLYITAWGLAEWILSKGKGMQGGTARGVIKILE
jgi:hypothetical protein